MGVATPPPIPPPAPVTAATLPSNMPAMAAPPSRYVDLDQTTKPVSGQLELAAGDWLDRPMRPATARTWRGAASQIATAEMRQQPIPIEKAGPELPVGSCNCPPPHAPAPPPT